MKLTLRLYILIIVLALSLLSIFGFPPAFLQKGALISSVDQNSVAFEAGFRSGQVIKYIDEIKVNSEEDYHNLLSEKFISGSKQKIILNTKDSEIIYYSDHTPDLTISSISKTNVKTGLDISGGSRALIKAKDQELTRGELNDLISVTNNRFNVYGISDVSIKSVSDISGKSFMLVEIAGATPEDLQKLISEQGKFEAKIGNQTVFEGGEGKGITSVARSGQQSGVESCHDSQSGAYCNFRFTIFLSDEAAKRHAAITNNLTIDSENPEYLSEKLDLYLDDKLVDSLNIGKGLKGDPTTQISISGSGSGADKEEAYQQSIEEMNNLQTILITGSLPYKLDIVKLDTISPILGHDFTKSILIAGLAALIAVFVIIFIRYRKIKHSLALIVTSICEIIIILGVAALIEWNLDLPSIAGIMATIGTGIDDLIVLLDESMTKISLSLKQKLKRAFAIIIGAYFTTLVSLIPLMWAGAGLLKGFAFTTIIGITAGVLITRPAFSDIIKRLEK